MSSRSVCLFSLGFLTALGGFSQLSAQSSIQVSSAVTARLPIPGNACTAPPAETNFLTTDNQVWVVFSYTGGAAGDTGYLEWFDPNGKLYVTSTLQQTVSGGTHCYYYYIGIFGYTPATEPGNWRVRLRWNDTEVFSNPFTISTPAASQLALVSNTTLPQATVGAPYSFTFQASGGTPPYKWSLSSGQLPPGLTLSTAGVLSGTATSPASYLLGLHLADSAGVSLNRDIALGVALPSLQIGVGSLSFAYTQGSAVPASQTFALSSNGSALPFAVTSDQSWLTATPASGNTPGTVTVAVQPQSLTPGSYQGHLTIQSNGSSTSQQSVTVSLAVLPAGTGNPGGIIRTVAGTDWTFTVPGGKGVNAPLGKVYGLAVDSSGNLYAADRDNSVVVKLAPNGTATTVAGNGFTGFSGEGGAAVNASLDEPYSVAVDQAGNLFIADTGNNRIRRVSASDGTITTIAGTGGDGFAGDGGPAVNALLSAPRAIVVDSSGNLFFYDAGNARIREVAGNGRILTVAGNGSNNYTAEGLATSVPTDVSYQMALDAAGNLYFGDFEHHVRKLTPAGQTVLIAGTGQAGSSGDNGPALNATFNEADGVAIDRSGNIYVADFNNGRIREILPNGTIVTYAGSGSNISSGDNGPALKAGMNPISLVSGSSGPLYLADYHTSVIRKVDSTQTITTVMGNNGYRSVLDGTPAINAFFNSPEGLAVDHSGNLIVADFEAQRIRKVTAAGVFSTIAGLGTPGSPTDGGLATASDLDDPASVAIDSQNNIYFADSGNHRIRRIGTDGKIATVAGAGDFETGGAFDGDGGPATKAHLNSPEGLALDASGNLYIADTDNHVIRRVGTDGNISTIAGTAQPSGTAQKSGFAGDGGSATKALLNSPYGVAVDAAGNIYIADTFNHSVRVVAPGGVISTYAGNQKQGFSGDGGPAKNASLNFPLGLTLDPAGNLYILEYGGNRIRQVTPAGIITTVAGTGTAGFSGDGGPSPAAQIRFPYGSMAYQSGTLYFTDTSNQRVRAISAGGASNVTSLSASTPTLALTAVSNGAATNKVTVSTSSSSNGLPVQVTATTSSGGAWLQVDTTSATCPATIGISANPAGLAAGSYKGTVTIASPYASPSQVSIAVTLTVSAAATGHLSTDSTPLSFRVLNGASPTTSQISLSNSGSGSLSFTAATSTSAGGAWLAVTPSNGTASAASPAALTITITPGSLAAGVYSGAISLSSPDNTDPPIVIPVTLLVSNPVPVILVSQTGLTYQSVQGGGNPLSQDIAILNQGQGTMNWTATAQALSGGNWLSISPASGTVTTPFVSFSTATVSVDASSLAPGNYFGQIQVRADGASNAPQTISVVLNVFAPGTVLPPEVRPSGLVFIGSATPPPGSQTVSIANRGTNAFTYNSFKGTLSNINWITNAPVAGSVPVNFPTRMTVQPDLSQRTPGVDRGGITVLFNDGSSQTVSVLSVVPPAGYTPNSEPGQIRAAGDLEPHTSGSCSASQLLTQLTNPSSAATAVPLGQPVSLELHLADDCGNNVSDKYPASVSVSFSTGEAGLTMQHSGNGNWTKTWQPRSTQPGTVIAQVTAFASGQGGKVLASQIPINITLSSVAQVPLVNSDGIKNAASYSSMPVVSPGGLIAIYGNQLADANGQLPPPGSVPTSLGHTQVKLGDALLPLFYTSNSQLNAQVPFSLPVNSQQQLVVQYGSTLSVPTPVSVAAAQPAIFTQNQGGTGQGSIVNGVTNILADSNHPVHAGDVISIYCTGLGPVNPAVQEGVTASTTVLSYTVTPVTATIGGQPGTVAFAGLAPGLIGVYQVNVVIPTGVTPGDSVPVVLTEGSQVSSPVTISVR